MKTFQLTKIAKKFQQSKSMAKRATDTRFRAKKAAFSPVGVIFRSKIHHMIKTLLDYDKQSKKKPLARNDDFGPGHPYRSRPQPQISWRRARHLAIHRRPALDLLLRRPVSQLQPRRERRQKIRADKTQVRRCGSVSL